jgi:hypothetical protein
MLTHILQGMRFLDLERLILDLGWRHLPEPLAMARVHTTDFRLSDPLLSGLSSILLRKQMSALNQSLVWISCQGQTASAKAVLS